MINDFRIYNYYTFGTPDEYGQQALSPFPVGTIKISIFKTSTTTQDNINYSNAQYIGFTHANINDSYIIDYEGKKLKALYIDKCKRIKQVFFSEV